MTAVAPLTKKYGPRMAVDNLLHQSGRLGHNRQLLTEELTQRHPPRTYPETDDR